MAQAGRETPNVYMRALVDCVAAIARRPRTTLVVAALVTAAAGAWAWQAFRMNSDDAALISQDEPFRRDFAAFVDAFPELEETTLVVVTSDSVALADASVDRLRDALLARTDLIETVHAPSADPFFEDHAFLYLNEADLEDVTRRLAEAQPALTALAEDPSVRGLFDQLERSLEALSDDGELPPGFARMADRVSDVTDGVLRGAPQPISWVDELLGADGPAYRLVIVQGRKDFTEAISTGRLIAELRATAADLGLVPENDVTVRLTGMVPLAHDEQESVQSGLALAGAISFTLLSIVLGFGVRSLRIVVATLLALVASITWTAAWAMLAVGEFNLISAAFAILMLGLGVDFAIHVGLRYEEECRRGLAVREALVEAARGAGGSVSLCALTSAIGFLSFVPTPYPGLGALGVIAGGGMFFALVASFTVFPAVLATMRAPSRRDAPGLPWLARANASIERHARAWVIAAVVIAALAGAASLRMTFDFSTLGMRDPASESMVTLRELQREEIVTDYSANVLADGPAEAEVLARRLEALDVVAEARAPSDYVPAGQDEKLLMLEDAAFFLEPVLHPRARRPPPNDAGRRAAIDGLLARIASLDDPGTDASPWPSLRRLRASLSAMRDGPEPATRLRALEALVVSDLGERLAWLRRALTVEAVSFDDLPVETRRRIVAPDGTARVVALPAEDISDVSALRRFVADVGALAPHATGRPAVEAGIGDIVVLTFRLAIGIAFTAVALVLLLALRSPLDAVLVLLPITLAALITTAFGVVADLPFNMTNVVVIPLILGLGVDNGIHVYLRYRHAGSLDRMMASSTPRAVLLSALTTLGAFGSLAVSGHRGMHSLGVLLSVSVVALLVCTLGVLPAMIAARRRAKAG